MVTFPYFPQWRGVASGKEDDPDAVTQGTGCVNSLLNHVSDGCFILGETGSDGSGMYPLVGIEDHNSKPPIF
jgi:hypothetical protein